MNCIECGKELTEIEGLMRERHKMPELCDECMDKEIDLEEEQ